MDDLRYGYLDFDNLKRYLLKFKKDVKKPDINALIRRLDADGDAKISFREFAVGITPEYPGLDAKHMEFNLEQK